MEGSSNSKAPVFCLGVVGDPQVGPESVCKGRLLLPFGHLICAGPCSTECNDKRGSCVVSKAAGRDESC
jgi:hypothetical protein